MGKMNWTPFCEREVWDLLLDEVAGNPGAHAALKTYVEALSDEIPAHILALREALENPSAHRERKVARIRRSAQARFLATVLVAGAGRIVFNADIKQGTERLPQGQTYERKQVPALVGALLSMSPGTINQLRPRNRENLPRSALEQYSIPELVRNAGPAEDEALSTRVKEYLSQNPGLIELPCLYSKIQETAFFEFITAPYSSPE